MIASDEIEGGHGLSFDWNSVAMQFQNVVMDINSWCGDYNILQKSSMRYLW